MSIVSFIALHLLISFVYPLYCNIRVSVSEKVYQLRALVTYTKVTFGHGLNLHTANYDACTPPVSCKVMHHSDSENSQIISIAVSMGKVRTQ